MSLIDQADRLLMDNKQAAHTPGPWTMDQGFTNDVFIRGTVGTLKPVVCRVDAHRDADARLIAAAPDMAQRLLDIVAAYNVGSASALEVWIKDTPALLAKAGL